MDYITIAVPDMNDSFSRVVLNGTAYLMRFTWNDTAQRWMWGLYTTDRTAIIEGVKVVPSFPINLPYGHLGLPAGAFGAISERKRPVRVHGSTAVAFSAGISVEKTLEKNAEKAPETSGENPV